MKAACDWVNGDTANPDEGVSFAIQAAITALPAIDPAAIRKAAMLDAGYDTPAINPAAIREAALREAAALCDRYPYVEGVKTALIDLIGETK